MEIVTARFRNPLQGPADSADSNPGPLTAAGRASAPAATEAGRQVYRTTAAPLTMPATRSRPERASWPSNGRQNMLGLRVEGGRISKTSSASSASKGGLSIEDLQAAYHMPRETAASKLGIGCTYLKKICRGHGIKRWPSRKLSALAKHVSELTKLIEEGIDQQDLLAEMHAAIVDAQDTTEKIYADANHPISRDLYRELHTFRKQSGKSD